MVANLGVEEQPREPAAAARGTRPAGGRRARARGEAPPKPPATGDGGGEAEAPKPKKPRNRKHGRPR
jgi:SecD/SecF fusion protein